MRRLVICADGTWNTPDKTSKGTPVPTNVIKMARAICPVDDRDLSQIVYYHDGVGTGVGVIDKILGGGFGIGVERNITDCYRFLVDNYHDGDEIFLFGFSRGAFTARSLGGMIRKCGVLQPDKTDMIPKAFEFYRSAVHPREPEAVRFRAENSKQVKLKMIGVWDTVGSLGIPGLFRFIARKRFAFHDVGLSSEVEHAYHAISIDEKRKPFAPTLWCTAPNEGQKFEQVWFAGVHSDVGGGYPEVDLSDLTFGWMVEKAKGAGLAFDEDYVRKIQGKAEGTIHESYSRLWQPLGRFDRKIGMDVKGPDGKVLPSNQAVHQSVHDRIAKVTMPPHGPYRPNLGPFASPPQ
jgi:uncharacterized protein (DUF2235 family)